MLFQFKICNRTQIHILCNLLKCLYDYLSIYVLKWRESVLYPHQHQLCIWGIRTYWWSLDLIGFIYRQLSSLNRPASHDWGSSAALCWKASLLLFCLSVQMISAEDAAPVTESSGFTSVSWKDANILFVLHNYDRSTKSNVLNQNWFSLAFADSPDCLHEQKVSVSENW